MPVEWWRVNCRGTEALLCSVEIRDRLASIKYKKVQSSPTSARTLPLPSRATGELTLPLPTPGGPHSADHGSLHFGGSGRASSVDLVPLKDLTWHEDSAKSLEDVLHADVSQWTLDKFFRVYPTRTLTIPLPPELSLYWTERENECYAWIKKFCTDPHYLCYYGEVEGNDLRFMVDQARATETEECVAEALTKLQQEVVKTIERKQRRWKLLEERGSALGGESTGETVEVLAHESVVGIVMGKQGENLSRVARSHKVEIRVYPDEEGVRRIRIYGQSPRQVYDACKELDYVYRSYQLPSSALGDRVEQLVKDTKSVQGKELSQINGIHSVWLRRSSNAPAAAPELFICGLRVSIAHYLKTLKKIIVNPEAASPAPESQRRGRNAWHSRGERGTYETAV